MKNELIAALVRILPFVAVILIIGIRLKQKKLSAHDINLQRPASYPVAAMWWFGFVVFILLTEVVLYQLGLLEVSKWNHMLLPSIIRITGAVILAPVAEELIFRGIILNLLNKKLNRHLAIFIQAAFFVALHSFTYDQTLSSTIGIVQSLIDATLFAYARYATNSLYTPMAMHATGNLVATLERFIL